MVHTWNLTRTVQSADRVEPHECVSESCVCVGVCVCAHVSLITVFKPGDQVNCASLSKEGV